MMMTHSEAVRYMTRPIRGIRRRQFGISLVELMVGMAIGLFVLSGALIVFGMSVRGGTDVLRGARLNQDLATATTIMANELRRAGLTAAQRDAAVALTSPGTTQAVTIPAANCILYQYDQNFDNTTQTTEQRAFALSGGALWMGQNVTNCTGITAGANWQPLTDPAIMTVTQLRFDTQGSKCRNLKRTGYWMTKYSTTVFPTVFPCADTTMSNIALYNDASPPAPASSQPTTRVGPAPTGLVLRPSTPLDILDNEKLAEIRRINILIRAELNADSNVSKKAYTSVTVANMFLTLEPD